jgi:hypothetical protein
MRGRASGDAGTIRRLFVLVAKLHSTMRSIALLLVIVLAIPASAADRRQIAALNIGGTALFTYLSCWIQKKPRTRCAAAGAVAGVGFYQAKRLVARGDITTGWLVANAATSIVENTTAGEHPLSRIGYTFGPLRLRVVTPADRKRESYVDIDLSLAETIYLARMLEDQDDIAIRDGMIWWQTDERSSEDGRVFNGYTWGIYPGLWRNAGDSTRNHEAVHAVQAQQLDSVDPPAFTIGRKPRPVRIRHVRIGAVNLLDNVTWGQVDYGDRWVEVEAYRLVDDRQPPQ